MNYKIISLLLAALILGCSEKDRYDPNTYYNSEEQKEILTSIITYIFDAPPYTSMKDRFNSEHRKYYRELTSRFSIYKYYISDNGINFFYVLRPAPKVGERRGVGGYFTVTKDYNFLKFHEIFVTPILPEQDAKIKGEFLFDKMVKGEVKEYLKMKSYVQWPNEASYYDTIKYEWVLDKSKI